MIIKLHRLHKRVKIFFYHYKVIATRNVKHSFVDTKVNIGNRVYENYNCSLTLHAYCDNKRKNSKSLSIGGFKNQ